MKTNFIAAWGPSGPLYLLKTNKHNHFWVINGGWNLYLDDLLSSELSRFIIIKDNFEVYSYQQACVIIESLYNKKLPHSTLSSRNVEPFNPDHNDLAQGKAQGQYNSNIPNPDVISNTVIEYKTPNVSFEDLANVTNELNEQAKEYIKHYNIDCNEIELNVMKQLIQDGFTIPEKNMSNLKTNIVTTTTEYKVNGENVENLSDDNLLNCIATLEESIDKLQKMTTKSTFVTKTITHQQETLAVVVKHLDSRN